MKLLRFTSSGDEKSFFTEGRQAFIPASPNFSAIFRLFGTKSKRKTYFCGDFSAEDLKGIFGSFSSSKSH
jgi:hypothetical protein